MFLLPLLVLLRGRTRHHTAWARMLRAPRHAGPSVATVATISSAVPTTIITADAGQLKLEGKDYVVADGDIRSIRFNV
jgi:hypothetical protein